MRPPVRGALAIALALTVAATVLVLADEARAVGETVNMQPGSSDVLEGRTVTINVTFGAADQEEAVIVTCPDEDCPEWRTTVEYDPDRSDCFPASGRRHCLVDFPNAFPAAGDGLHPLAMGEPAHVGPYTVKIGPEGSLDQTTFDVHLSTAGTCLDDRYRRGETLTITTSGIPDGEWFDVELYDEDLGQTVLEQTRRSNGSGISYDFTWRPPLDYPLGRDENQTFEVRIESPSKGKETETFRLQPGLARARVLAAPGFGQQPRDFNRTTETFYALQYSFPGRPPDCLNVPFRQPISVTPAALASEHLRARVNKIDNATGQQRTYETVDQARARFFPARDIFLFNYTVPRDAEATHNRTTGPYYDLEVRNTELADGNKLQAADTLDFRVHPYTIVPRFEVLQDEVERLETARLVVNLTYADGSPFSPNDTDSEVQAEFGLVGEPPEFTFDLEYQGSGLWSASTDLPFEYEPLGEYVWRVLATEDDYGRFDEHNRLRERVSDVVDVVGARPVIDMRTIVGNSEVDGVQRTQTVHVTLHAEFKNGVPLTEDNADGSLGGVALRVKKVNAFGRIVDVDSLVMTAANDDGDWVRSYRVGRSETSAPAGTWQLQVIARDDSDPPNENTTSFPFEVEPARVSVSPIDAPPALVDGDEIDYRFRLTYPDGTIFTESLAEPSRGGEVTVELQRVRPLGQPPTVEASTRPRSVSGGQAWHTTFDASKTPPGSYFLNVSGRDIHGNDVGPEASRLFTVLFEGTFRNSSTPICPDLPGGERCTRERGTDIFAVFPGSDGDKGLQGPDPEIRVLRKIPGQARWVTHEEDVRISHEAFRNRTGRDAGDSHVGHFATDESTPQGRYRLYIIGRAADDTGFAGYTQSFNVTPITVERRVVDPLPATVQKGESMTATIEHRAGDVIDLARAQAGQVGSRAVTVTSTAVGTFVEWTPTRITPTGPATIQLQGRDLFGNPFEVTLGPVQVQPLDVDVRVSTPPDEEALRGRFVTAQAELTYPNGRPMTPEQGEPVVTVLDATGNKVAQTDTAYARGHWKITWQPPPSIATGRYVIEFTGEDISGNVIETVQTRTFQVVPGEVSAETVRQPEDLRRGGLARATFNFDTQIESVNASVTTGTDDLGEPEATVDNGTVTLRFPTTRTTPLVQPIFRVEGRDVYGNDLADESHRFQINPMQMRINWLDQPRVEIPRGGVAKATFEIRYPDGSNLRAGQGSPIAGLFIRNSPRGSLDTIESLEDDPTVWRVTWNPPENVQANVPFHFAVSALDRWQNEAPPVTSRGFFVTNPIVPDYLPTPGFPAWGALLAALGAAAAASRVRRRA